MDEPIQAKLTLAELSNTYAVFEPNQVLSSGHLNSVTDYLNDQARITRTQLLGVGLIEGGFVSVASGKVTVTKCLGVTTDGDVLQLLTDTSFDRYREYGKAAPRYAPFYNDEEMRKVYELVRENETSADAKPLTTLTGFADMVVVIFMESYQKKSDLCTGTECDNLGKTAVDTLRLLLVSPQDAVPLFFHPSTVSDAASQLPDLFSDRALLDKTVTTTAALVKTYATVCEKTLKRVTNFITELSKALQPVLLETFRADPTPEWRTALETRFNDQKSGNGILYYYDHLKDVVDTANELRDELVLDDNWLSPAPAAFPKHLLLGQLSNSTEYRMECYPSPLVGRGHRKTDHARFLLEKLAALVVNFKIPTNGQMVVRVTPSFTEAASLENRAIPFYYDPLNTLRIAEHWNHRLARRGASESNLGYHAASYGGTELSLNPLAAQIGRYDFFRVEGHIGFKVADVTTEIERQIRASNLPFIVRSVLLHNALIDILVKPPIRYDDLHRLHYLLRTEVAMHLNDSDRFNGQFKAKVDEAVTKPGMPTDRNFSATASSRFNEIQGAIGVIKPTMELKTYVDYLKKPSWPDTYTTVVNSTSAFKTELGEIVHTDVATPFDTVAVTNHPAWLTWLDQLIKDKEKHADNKLRFQNFIEQHSAFEHFGGVPRGGTLVLVYDETGRVVADGTLPYAWLEHAEEEPKEGPVLERPKFKPSDLIDKQIRITPPILNTIDTKLNVFEDKLNPRIDMQKDYMKFFEQSIRTLSPILVPKVATVPKVAQNFSDPLFGMSMEGVRSRIDQVEQIRTILARPDIDDGQRERATAELKSAQEQLSNSITDATIYLTKNNLKLDAESDGGKGLTVLASGIGQISDTAIRDQMVNSLKATQAATVAATHNVAIGNLVAIIGR